MNKHYDNAMKIIETAGENFIQYEGWTETTAMMATVDANTQATLALAYEQRTANLIALFDHTQYVAAFYGDHDKIAAEVRERLGLK